MTEQIPRILIAYGVPALFTLAGCPSGQSAQPVAGPAPAASENAPAAPVVLEQISALGDGIRQADTQLLPQLLTSFGAATQGEWLYVLGGYFGKPHEYSKAGQSGALYRVRLGESHEWQRLPGIEPLQSLALVAYDGGLVRIGGMRALNEPGQDPVLVSVDEVARYVPARGVWQDMPRLPAPRSSHDAVLVGSTIYVVGGWRLTETSGFGEGQWYESGLMLDLEAKTPAWAEFPVPFQRRALALVATDNHIFAVGGMEDGEHSSRVDIYDVATKTWTRGPDYPADGFGAAGVAIGGRVYVSGMDGEVHSIAPGESAWRLDATLVFPRYFHRLARAADDRLVAVGGIMLGGERVRSIETVALGQAPAGKPRMWRFRVAAPSPAKHRQGVFLYKNQLYAFGGNKDPHASRDFEPDDLVTDAHRLSLASLSWQAIAPYPERRQNVRAVVDEQRGEAIAVGGFGTDESGQTRPFPDVFVFDLRKQAWTPRNPALPMPRTQFELLVRDQSLWLLGGFEWNPASVKKSKYSAPVDVLATALDNPRAAFAATGVTLPRPRRAFAGAELDQRFYLVGGLGRGLGMVEPVDVYDFRDKTWQTIPSPAHKRIAAELVAMDGKLYLAGGTTFVDGMDTAPVPSVEMYDPKNQAWTTIIEELPIDPTYLSMFEYHGRLLIYTAYTTDDAVDIVLIEPSR